MDKKAPLIALHTAQHGEPFVTIAKYQITSPKSADRLTNDDVRAISIVQAIDDQINVSMSPSLPRRQKSPTICKVFPDSGASICLAGTSHLSKLNIQKTQLILCSQQITVVGESMLNCFGWLPMTFSINKLTTRQPLFFCGEADRIYLS